MKNKRQVLIIDLIEKNVVETQEQLLRLLGDNGVHVSQATMSRDMDELNLCKTLDADGNARYAVKGRGAVGTGGRPWLLEHSVTGAEHVGAMVAVKCHAGMASAVCTAIDAMKLEQIVGTIAGEDTIFILARSEADAAWLCEELTPSKIL